MASQAEATSPRVFQLVQSCPSRFSPNRRFLVVGRQCCRQRRNLNGQSDLLLSADISALFGDPCGRRLYVRGNIADPPPDFYDLARIDQPLVMDYIHRLCKDLPLYFKVATLRHASTLYADRKGQPIGAQERHDYQPINVDFTFSNFKKTVEQNKKILLEFGRQAVIQPDEIEGLFKGTGFERLVLAGGGVPRDCLSLFLEVLESVQPPNGDGRIGKDDVRILSRANFERRIEELKQDSGGREQGVLIKGIYVLRQFCIDRKTNVGSSVVKCKRGLPSAWCSPPLALNNGRPKGCSDTSASSNGSQLNAAGSESMRHRETPWLRRNSFSAADCVFRVEPGQEGLRIVSLRPVAGITANA
ncbi:MAG TPA: hypothetical protein VEL76_08475 [Gemmataceae bacterium]|nr:hypothetical protein [Gemmataceae bacterium]